MPPLFMAFRERGFPSWSGKCATPTSIFAEHDVSRVVRFVVVFNDADEAVRAVTALRSLLKHIEHLDVGVLPPSSFDPNGASEVAHNLIVAAGGGLPQIKVDVGEAQRYVDIVVDRLVRYLRGEHSINGSACS